MVYGLPTLAMRMGQYQESARRIAEFLDQHPKIADVRYPGLESFPQYELAHRQMVNEHGEFSPGSMMYFVVKEDDGSGRNGEQLIDWVAENSYCITLAVSLGQIKTLIECPYSMTHQMMPDEEKRERGMLPGGCRISVGLEDSSDLIADLSDALDSI